LLSGFAGGLFGIGGGIVTVPALYAVFSALGVDPGHSLKTAVGTSLAVIVVTSLRSLAEHGRSGHVDARVLRAWAPWIALGAAAAGLLARHVPGEALATVFVAGAFFIGARRLFGRQKIATAHPRDLTDVRIHIPLGIGTGAASTLMGLGGGAVGVMMMRWSGRSMHEAVATASGFGVAVALPGAAGFVVSGWEHAGLPPLSFGYVNAPAFVLMALASAATAPFGARIAHRTRGELLSRLFALYILAAAAGLLWDMMSR
jgi:uncharacterized membrane protein YfcA